MFNVNAASERCISIPSVSGVPSSSVASASITMTALSGRLNLAAGLKIALLPI